MPTKKSTPSSHSYQLGDRGFVGIDTYTAPNRLIDGYFQNLQNMLVYGNALQPRNGWSTCWHSAAATYNPGTGYPIYELITLKDRGVKSKVAFSSNGKLYYYDTSTYGLQNNLYAEVFNRSNGNASFAFPNSKNVRMTMFGRYVYGVDGAGSLFRLRMNGQIPEAETLPVLDDLTKYTPKATASPLTVMRNKQLGSTYTTPIDVSGFSSAPSVLTNKVNNPTFNSNVASGFGEWNYNTANVEYLTSGTKTVGATIYRTFANTAKNADNFVATRDGNTGFCVKVDKIQDILYQDIDVRDTTVTYDEAQLVFTASSTVNPTYMTLTAGHGLSIGQAIKFSTTVGGVSTSTTYYVKSVVSDTVVTITTSSTVTSGTVFTFTANVTSGANKIIIQHNAGLYALTFYVYNQDDIANFVSQNTIDVTIDGYTQTGTSAFSSNNRIGGAEVYFNAQPAAGQNAGDWHKFQVLVDFRQYDKILTGIQIRFAPTFMRGGDSWVLLDDVSLYALNSKLEIGTQDDAKGLAKLVARQANQTFITDTSPVDPFANYLENEAVKINLSQATQFTVPINSSTITCVDNGGVHGLQVGDFIQFTNTTGGVTTSTSYYVKTTPTTGTFTVTTDSTLASADFVFTAAVTSGANTYTQYFDFRNTQSISIRASFSEKINQSVPPFSLGIRYNDKTQFTGQCRYDKTLGYLTFDLYPITTTNRAVVSSIYVRFDYDLELFYDNEWVISFGEVTKQGALTPQTKYAYSFSLWTPYTKPTSVSMPYWSTFNFTVTTATSTTIINTATAHNLGVGKRLIATNGVGGLSAGATYYVKDILTTTSFIITTDSTLVGSTFVFTADVTSGANTFTPVPETPNQDGFETNASKYSTDVVITEAVNKVTIELSANYLNVSANGFYYKYACVYRRNLLTGDNMSRLIGLVDLDTGLAYVDGSKWEGFTSSYSGTALTVVDQVPDSQLLFDNGPGTRGYRYRVGKDQYPVGCDCIAVYNQRLFASKKNTIYASWALNTNNEYGLYTTAIVDPLDPEVAIKGATFTLSNQNDEEQIMGMQSIQGDGLMRDNSTSAALVIMREHSTYLLTGDSPHNFANQGFLQGSGSGLVAKRGSAVLMGRLIITTANGIMQLDSTRLTAKGLQLEGVLNPRSQDYVNGQYAYVPAASYANITMCVHDRRLLVLAPAAGEAENATNTKMYVYDTRTEGFNPRTNSPINGGWVNWNNPVAFTSLVAVETTDDTQDLYAGGRDGKLYKFDRFADGVYSDGASTPGRTYTAIPWVITTRQYGQSYTESYVYYSANKIHSLNLHIANQDTSTLGVNWSITGQKGYSTAGTFTFDASSDKVVSLRSISRTADQQTFSITLSGTSSKKWKLYALHTTTTEGNTPRR